MPGCPFFSGACPIADVPPSKDDECFPTCPHPQDEPSQDVASEDSDPCIPSTCKHMSMLLGDAEGDAARAEDTCYYEDPPEKRAEVPCPCNEEKPENLDSMESIERVSGNNLEPCTPNTCRFKGGELDCDECNVCPCVEKGSADEDQPSPKSKKPKVKTKRGRGFGKNAWSVPVISKKKFRSVRNNGVSSEKAIGSPEIEPKRGKKRRSKFVYNGADNYPGVKIGHRYCLEKSRNVPHNMGWLWNIEDIVSGLKVIQLMY